MSQVYEFYKPFRNRVRAYNLTACFEDLWAYSQHLLGDRPIPDRFVQGRVVHLKDHLYPWNLVVLARELVLHASDHGQSRINTWPSLATIVNALRDFENRISENEGSPDTVLALLHSIAHQQFPWQGRRDKQSLMRYLKIFGAAEVERVLVEKTGLTMRDLYFMGLAVSGHLLKHPGVSSDQRYTDFGISREKSSEFFQKLSIDVGSLREKTKVAQRYDETWEYTWNPLEATPLVSLDKRYPNRLHCPIPELLMRRISQGVFYDLINAANFDNAYGRAYQQYVGDVMREIFSKDQFRLWDERAYSVGKSRKDGVDWILSDGTASVFFECKTKRIRQDAKIAAANEAVSREISVLGAAVVQLYKNLDDALAGRTTWRPDGNRVYPLVLTLEDWYLFSPPILGLLHSTIVKGVADAGLNTDLINRCPYSIASIREFERIAPVVNVVGVKAFFETKTKPEYSNWMIDTVAQNCFPEAWRQKRPMLFRKDWERLIPELAGRAV